jgi:ribonuclease E
MAKKMLIDATHTEETRVVVVDGNKVEEFDFESQNKRQLAGNIYLAKVSRVEPSLQAAFVEYGGNRHGFLAFSEIHPDYYQIPMADREALLAEEKAYAEAQAAAEDEKPKRTRRRRGGKSKTGDEAASKTEAAAIASDDAVETKEVAPELSSDDIPGMGVVDLDEGGADREEGHAPVDFVKETPVETPATAEEEADASAPDEAGDPKAEATDGAAETEAAAAAPDEAPAAANESDAVSEDAAEEAPEAATAEAADDDDEDEELDATDKDESIESVADEDVTEEIRAPRKRQVRRYKIQEVVKVRQIMLVQVVKEERGNKGAALTTYLSLAGRYCVLMPNTARGGGISRKITNAADRKKLKAIASEIDVPDGAGLIVRTAGAKRTKSEIKRDYEYLQRLWEQIRELTLKSIAPAKIYEEGDLIKRSIRDLYSREIDEVLVEGEGGYRTAKDFMKMIMPSHAKNVKHYSEGMPLFARHQVESYLSAMFNPTVQLKSGGYIVIGVTEALVAIDVNSGRATKKGSIEETALETNLEAAEEIARQLRLRDLAGLIVIDFIDMEERRNNSAVEKRFKDKLKTDRARIQVGRISGFGLMEMSRQRLRPGMLEATTQPCPHCHGTGLVRSDDNLALNILRQLEEEGTRRKNREVLLTAPVGICNYLINHKREHIAQIEARYGMAVRIEGDPFMISPDFTIEKFKTATRVVAPAAPVVSVDASMMPEEEDEEEVQVTEAVTSEGEDGEEQPKKRRRRRRRRRGGTGSAEGAEGSPETGDAPSGEQDEDSGAPSDAPVAADAEADADAAVSTAPAEAGEDEAPTEKPKRRRSRSRKKVDEAPKEADASEDAAAAPVADAEADAAAAPEAEEAPQEKPKRKRATRSRKKKDEPVAEEAPAAEVVAEGSAEPATAPEAAAPEAEAAAPEPVAVAEPAADVAEEPVPVTDEAAEEPVEEAAPETAPEPAPEPESPPKPKRRGWWSLGGS